SQPQHSNPLQKDPAPNMDPAEQLDLEQVKIALGNQGVAIGKHEQTLQQILAQLQGLTARLARNPPPTIQPVPQGPDPVLAEQPVAAAPPSAHFVEPPLPAPMRYGGEPGGCRGFLLQCSLAFELQPSRFQSERAKVAYIVSLLTGKALAWATPVWVHQPGVCTTAMLFAEALSRTFDLPVRGEEAGARLLNLRQGRRSVSEYAIEFRTLAAESGWNASALASAFHHGLNEDLKDELAHRDSPTTLDDLIELTQRLDNRLRERYRVRTGDGPPSPTGNRGRPVQLRHTRLSQEERDTRMRDGRCLYCGTAGHQRTDCPQLVLKRQHPLGGEEPLTDRPGFPRTTGVFLNATLACGDSEVRLPAFLDSGAAGNFLDAATARKLALPLVRLREPLPIEAIDGRSLEPGMVSHQTRPLTLRVGSHSEQITLFIISAPDLQLVLGFPWLQRHNPHVDWLSRSVLAWGPACRTSCLQPSQAPRGTNLDPEAADLSRVPTDYHDLGEVFSKKKAQILPPHRPCDMAIDLLPGTSPPRGRLFSLSGPERRAMEEYIQEALALGFIRPSSSPAGAGFFFVGKKDGGLRPCIDYRGLNKITVKNRYPLPLMSSAFEALQQATIFTKLDLHPTSAPLVVPLPPDPVSWVVPRPTLSAGSWTPVGCAGASSTWWIGRAMGRRNGPGCPPGTSWTPIWLGPSGGTVRRV
uniref:CCHC-type domain-containing protein n=1 Tax=Astyanax mexicanus TaxID=7994 RepID=A0A3B1J8V9_ASTMX